MTISVFMLCRFENSRISAIRSLCVDLDCCDFYNKQTSCGDKGILGGTPGDVVESLHTPRSPPALPDFRGPMEMLCAAPASPGGGGSQRCLKGAQNFNSAPVPTGGLGT